MPSPSTDVQDTGSVLVGPKGLSRDPNVNRTEALYRAGRTREALASCDSTDRLALEAKCVLRLDILRGMSLFDLGDCTEGLTQLAAAEDASKSSEPDLQFAAAFALFVRQADFQAPDEALLGLSRLRQLATIAGDAQSLAGLHFAVARVEGYRGFAADAHRHLEIARRFAERSGHEPLRCTLEVVGVSLAFMAGNLRRAQTLADASLAHARAAGFKKYIIASQANAAAVNLYLGELRPADRLAQEVLSSTAEMPQLRLGVLDTLAQLGLHRRQNDAVCSLLAECAATIAAQQLPARSWAATWLTQLTRCAYFEQLEEWRAVLKVATETEPELIRRQFRTLRTSLLCARARAWAHLGESDLSEGALTTAMRICPRGSIDSLIGVEASRGLCRALVGDRANAVTHFDRASAGCRAIGSRYHEVWVERSRSAVISGLRPGTVTGESVSGQHRNSSRDRGRLRPPLCGPLR